MSKSKKTKSKHNDDIISFHNNDTSFSDFDFDDMGVDAHEASAMLNAMGEVKAEERAAALRLTELVLTHTDSATRSTDDVMNIFKHSMQVINSMSPFKD